MAYSLLFTLLGTPILRNGQEIRMSDDLSLEERKSVRTFMKWDGEKPVTFLMLLLKSW